MPISRAVAPLAGSEGRNKEISVTDYEKVVAPLAGSEGRNPDDSPEAENESVAPLAGSEGRNRTVRVLVPNNLPSLPSRGARVEISEWLLNSKPKPVAPLAGSEGRNF